MQSSECFAFCGVAHWFCTSGQIVKPAEQRVCSKRVCIRVIRVKELSILAHFPPLLRFSFYKHLLTYPPTNNNILFIKKFRVLSFLALWLFLCRLKVHNTFFPNFRQRWRGRCLGSLLAMRQQWSTPSKWNLKAVEF